MRLYFRKKPVADVVSPEDPTALKKPEHVIDASRAAKWAEPAPRPLRTIKKISLRNYIFGFLGGAFFFLVIVGYISYRARSESIASTATKAQVVLHALGRGDSKGVLNDLQSFGSIRAPQDPLDIFKTVVIPFFTQGKNKLTNFETLVSKTNTLLLDIAFLENHALADMFDGNGNVVVDHVSEAHDALHTILETQKNLGSFVSPALNTATPSLNADLPYLDAFLGVATDWLRGNHHILVLFGNTAENRPGGGFIGSYADVTMRGGNIAEIDVHDINDADRAFSKNVVPPRPLQALETRWHIADANWFLNFPDSAKTLTAFFNDIHASSSISFDTVIAITPAVIEDLLTATGPITLKNGLVINSKNVMHEIQTSVETKQASHTASPKSILGELEPLLFGELRTIPQDAQSALLEKANHWLTQKDLIFYFVDPHLESFFGTLGWTGKTFEPSADFLGDYFALVGANVGGGKTSLVVGEKVDFQSRIDTDGTVYDHVTFARTHHGDKETQWWYRTPNQEYIQVLAMLASVLSDEHGGFWKAIVPPLNYDRAGYSRDPLITTVESTEQSFVLFPAVRSYKENGLRTYATWSKVANGKTDTISFDYTHKLFVPPADGLVYTFVFDKQPGTNRSYHFEIDAPPGFRFRENGLPAFEYQNDDPPGRFLVNLTLEKM